MEGNIIDGAKNLLSGDFTTDLKVMNINVGNGDKLLLDETAYMLRLWTNKNLSGNGHERITLQNNSPTTYVVIYSDLTEIDSEETLTWTKENVVSSIELDVTASRGYMVFCLRLVV